MMLSRRTAATGSSRFGYISNRSSLVCKPLASPIAVPSNSPVAAVRARSSRRTTIKAQPQAAQAVLQGLESAQTLVLPTIFARATDSQEMMKANVVLPPSKDGRPLPQEGDRRSVKARGVVLFMHGFAQGPTAYARMLTQLAADDVVVVAPCPPFGATPDAQQKYMVDAAAFWRDLMAQNQLPGLTLLGDTAQQVGLLGHSVGGGLAAYVADAAARKGQAFAAAHVLAPQTTQVVAQYRYDVAHGGSLLRGVRTEWGVQYGLIDLLSRASTVKEFQEWLEAKGKLRSSVKYELGTHVGFEDQLVVGGESFSTDVLPWVLAVLWGTLSVWLPWVALSTLSSLRGGAAVRAAAPPAAQQQRKQGAEGAVPESEGFGVPDDVELPDERVMLLGYVLLAATVTIVENAIPGFHWDSIGAGVASVIKGVFLILAVCSWPALMVYPYEAVVQRPEARRQVVSYFRNMMPAREKVLVKS